MSNIQFEIGYQYNWWRANYYYAMPKIIIVDIAPDRSYLLGTNPESRDPLKAEKFKIFKDPHGVEKLSRHPGPMHWETCRADKNQKYVGVPEGWYDGAKARRKEGAAKASSTKSEKKLVKAIADSVDLEKYAKIRWLSNPESYTRYKTWEDLYQYFKDNNWSVKSGSDYIQKAVRKRGEAPCLRTMIFAGPGDARGGMVFIYKDMVDIGASNTVPITGEKFEELFSDVLD